MDLDGISVAGMKHGEGRATRLRVPLVDLSPGRVVLDLSTSHYVARVHRLGSGDRFMVFDPQAKMEAEAEVVSVRRGRVSCEVRMPVQAEPVDLRPRWLLLGVGKEDPFSRAIRDATALGVTRIIPTVCSRSPIRADEAMSRGVRWRRVITESARQCGRVDVPELQAPVGLQEALEMADAQMVKVCLWERAQVPFRTELSKLVALQGLALLVGPEGGLEAGEVEAASSAGFAMASLGGLVLRMETAVACALGAALVLLSSDPASRKVGGSGGGVTVA